MGCLMIGNMLPLNKYFWTIVYFIVVKNKYITLEGRILSEVVKNGGYYSSMSDLAKVLKERKAKVNIISFFVFS